MTLSYFAFRELGRVVRTIFLLRYLSSVELRHTIQAATNKSEAFNRFVQWVCFGGDGVIAENVRDEQRKFIKYNHLVANLLTFHTLVTITSALRQLLQEGHPADTEALATLSPYQTEHINRFGNFLEPQSHTRALGAAFTACTGMNISVYGIFDQNPCRYPSELD